MNAAEFKEYDLPEYWASYLINGDCSGMDDSDVAACDAWIESILAEHDCCFAVDVSEPWFSAWHDASSFSPLAGNVATFTIQTR